MGEPRGLCWRVGAWDGSKGAGCSVGAFCFVAVRFVLCWASLTVITNARKVIEFGDVSAVPVCMCVCV